MNENVSKSIFKNPVLFWVLTFAITALVHWFVFSMYGDTIIGSVFGYEYGDGVESWIINVAIWAGPWGFLVCGLIGNFLWNLLTCNDKMNLEWLNYLLSDIFAIFCSALWIPIVYVLDFVVMVVAYLLAAAFVITLMAIIISGFNADDPVGIIGIFFDR